MNIKGVLRVMFGLFALCGSLDLPGADNPDLGRYASDSEKLQLIQKLVQPWNSVSKLQIEFEAVVGATNIEQMMGVHRVMAMAAPGELYAMTAHFTKDYPWEVDPFRQDLFIHRGTYCHEWAFKRSYSEGVSKPGDGLPGTAPEDILFLILPKWFLTDYRIPVGSDLQTPVLPSEALLKQHLHMLQGREVISGEECVVFKSTTERIWIAAQKSFCVMQREFYWTNSGELFQKVVTDQITQVGPNLWFPSKFRRQLFSRGNSPNQSRLEQESTVNIFQCKLNDAVQDSVFVYQQRPGSLIYERDNTFHQVSPGGEDLLDSIVLFATRYGKLPSPKRWYVNEYLWLTAGVLLGFCINCFGSRTSVPKVLRKSDSGS